MKNEDNMEVSREISRLYLEKCREADRHAKVISKIEAFYWEADKKRKKWKRKYKYLKLIAENMRLKDEIARYKALMEDDRK